MKFKIDMTLFNRLAGLAGEMEDFSLKLETNVIFFTLENIYHEISINFMVQVRCMIYGVITYNDVQFYAPLFAPL